MEKIILTDRVKIEEVLHIVKEEMNLPQKIQVDQKISVHLIITVQKHEKIL
jgi:hypothetical protein